MSFIQAFINTLLSMQTPEMYNIGTRILFNAIGVVCAVIILALFVVPAIITKKNMGISIVAGVASFLSAILMPLYVRLFHTLPIVVEVQPGSVDEAMANLIRTLLKSFGILAITVLMLVAFVLSIIYIVKAFKYKPAIFAVAALIINIIRYLYVAPYQTMFPVIFKLIAQNNPAIVTIMTVGQAFQLVVYYAAIMLPLVLVLFASLISALKSKKADSKAEEKEPLPADETANATLPADKVASEPAPADEAAK